MNESRIYVFFRTDVLRIPKIIHTRGDPPCIQPQTAREANVSL